MEKKQVAKYNAPTAVSLIVGTVVGIGIFFKAPSVLELAQQQKIIAMISWILGGVATLAGGLTVAEISSMIPEANGLSGWGKYIVTKLTGSKRLGDYTAFLFSFVLCFIYGPSIILIVGYYAIAFITSGIGGQLTTFVHLAILIFIFFTTTLLQIVIPRLNQVIQKWATFIKIIPIVLGIIAIFLFKTEGVNLAASSTAVKQVTQPFIIALAASFLPVLFAYDGWIHVTSIATRLKKPEKQLPVAIIIGLGIVIVIYLLLNIPMLILLPANQIVSIGGIAGLAGIVFGPTFGNFMLLVIGISAFAGMLGMFIVFSFMPYNMAKANLLPKKYLLKINTQNEPLYSVMFLTALLLFYLFLAIIIGYTMMEGAVDKAIDLIGDFPVGAIWLLYVIVFVGIVILRFTDKDIPRPYRIIGYPITPIIAISSSLFALFATVVRSWQYFIFMVVMAGIGLYFYHLCWNYQNKQRKKTDEV